MYLRGRWNCSKKMGLAIKSGILTRLPMIILFRLFLENYPYFLSSMITHNLNNLTIPILFRVSKTNLGNPLLFISITETEIRNLQLFIVNVVWSIQFQDLNKKIKIKFLLIFLISLITYLNMEPDNKREKLCWKNLKRKLMNSCNNWVHRVSILFAVSSPMKKRYRNVQNKSIFWHRSDILEFLRLFKFVKKLFLLVGFIVSLLRDLGCCFRGWLVMTRRKQRKF